MKAVLISIQPQWCELIASGRKTIEVRKTRPKIETPFKCYIYMTATKERCRLWEYITAYQNSKGDILNGSQKVIGEFVCDRIEKFSVGSLLCDDIGKESCLNYFEMINYFYKPEELDGKTVKWGYGWHLSDLKIYDKPKELVEFRKPCNHINDCCTCKEAEFQYYEDELRGIICKRGIPLTRPPQSWCYVEELE